MLRRFPAVTVLLALAAAGVYFVSGDAALHLQFERDAIAAGELWRLLTCHFTHFDRNHLAWDVAALVVLGAAGERGSRRRTLLALGLAAVAIPVAVLTFQPQFETYRGLSGLDSALFGLFAGSLLEQRRRAPILLGVLALGGVLAKTAYEVATGTPAFATGSGYAPVPLAHLIGVICGAGATWPPRAIFPRRESCSAAPPPCPRSRFSPAPSR